MDAWTVWRGVDAGSSEDIIVDRDTDASAKETERSPNDMFFWSTA